MSTLPTPLIVHVTRPLSGEELLELSRRATLTLWSDDAFQTFESERRLEAWLRRSYAAVAFLDREVSGWPLAAALRCDWLAMRPDASLVVRGTSPVSSRAWVGGREGPVSSRAWAGGREGREISPLRTMEVRSPEPAAQLEHATGDILAALAARSTKRLLPLVLAADNQRVPDAHCASLRRITAAGAISAGIADSLVADGEDSLKWLRNWLGARSLRALDAAATLLRQNRSETGERIEFARLFSTGEPQRGLSHFLEKTPAPFASEITVETI